MSTSSSDSSSDGVLFQVPYYVGVNLQNVLYGIELVLYFKTVQVLVTRNRGARRKSDVFYALFSSMMVFAVTVWIVTGAIFGQEMWLLQNNYPGAPVAYWNKNISIWYLDWGMTLAIVLQLMTDGLMIYRCKIIWNSYRVIVIPVILWLCTLVLGVSVDWTSSSPGGDFFSGFASQLGLSYYSVSVFLNTTLTCMICFRMLRHGKKVQEGLGDEYASPYFTIVTIVIESVVPYTLSGIAFLVSFGTGSPSSSSFLGVYILMMCISPQMVILRVIISRTWDKNAGMLPVSTLKFSPGGTSGSQWFDTVSRTEVCVPVQTSSNGYVVDEQESKVFAPPVSRLEGVQ